MAPKSETDRFYASPRTIQHLLDLGRETIASWITTGKIVEGIHFVLLERDRRFNVPLMLDRLANYHDDAAHQRAIENWLETLPSNQPMPKRLKQVG